MRNRIILTSMLVLGQFSAPAFARKKEPPPLPECPVDTVIRTADPRLIERYSALAGCRPQVLFAPADPSEYTPPKDTRIADVNSNQAGYAIDRQGSERDRFQNQYAGLPNVAVSDVDKKDSAINAAKPENGIAVEQWTYATKSDRQSLAGTGSVFRIAPEFPEVPADMASLAGLTDRYAIGSGQNFAVNTLPTPNVGVDRNAELSKDAASILAMRPKSYRTQFDALIAEVANRHRIDPLFLHAVIQQESGYKQFVVSHAGARGLMQIMPATGRSLGVSTPNLSSAPHNVDAGARLLRKLYFKYDGNFELVLAAYNAGEGAVAKYGNKIPPYRETQNYVKSIMARYYKLLAEQNKDGAAN